MKSVIDDEVEMLKTHIANVHRLKWPLQGQEN